MHWARGQSIWGLILAGHGGLSLSGGIWCFALSRGEAVKHLRALLKSFLILRASVLDPGLAHHGPQKRHFGPPPGCLRAESGLYILNAWVKKSSLFCDLCKRQASQRPSVKSRDNRHTPIHVRGARSRLGTAGAELRGCSWDRLCAHET